MSDAQMALMIVGFTLNLVVMIVGGLGLAFKAWRWVGDLAERIARVEANVEDLQRNMEGGRRGSLRSTKR